MEKFKLSFKDNLHMDYGNNHVITITKYDGNVLIFTENKNYIYRLGSRLNSSIQGTPTSFYTDMYFYYIDENTCVGSKNQLEFDNMEKLDKYFKLQTFI